MQYMKTRGGAGNRTPGTMDDRPGSVPNRPRRFSYRSYHREIITANKSKINSTLSLIIALDDRNMLAIVYTARAITMTSMVLWLMLRLELQ